MFTPHELERVEEQHQLANHERKNNTNKRKIKGRRRMVEFGRPSMPESTYWLQNDNGSSIFSE